MRWKGPHCALLGEPKRLTVTNNLTQPTASAPVYSGRGLNHYLERVAIGGGPPKRHRNAKGAVSRRESSSSEVVAACIVRPQQSAGQTLTMTLRSRMVRTTVSVAVHKVGFGYGSARSSIVGFFENYDGNRQSRAFLLP